MAGVELAQNLAEQLGKVVTVVDIGQEAAIFLRVAVPVDAVDILVVELVLHQTLHVVEHIFAFCRSVERRFGAEVDGFHITRAQVIALDGAVGHRVELLRGTVGEETSVAPALLEHLRLLLLEVHYPEVAVVIKRRYIIEFVALGVEPEVA